MIAERLARNSQIETIDDVGGWKLILGVPRDIVSPRAIQVVIQKDRRKQAELERPAGLKLLDDLPGAEVLFVGVGADEVEVELIGKGLGEEITAAGERDSRSKNSSSTRR